MHIAGWQWVVGTLCCTHGRKSKGSSAMANNYPIYRSTHQEMFYCSADSDLMISCTNLPMSLFWHGIYSYVWYCNLFDWVDKWQASIVHVTSSIILLTRVSHEITNHDGFENRCSGMMLWAFCTQDEGWQRLPDDLSQGSKMTPKTHISEMSRNHEKLKKSDPL